MTKFWIFVDVFSLDTSQLSLLRVPAFTFCNQFYGVKNILLDEIYSKEQMFKVHSL